MKCKHVQPLLSDHLDGRLRPAQQDAVEAHLGECPSCARQRDELRQTLQLVSQLGRLRCPTDCRPAVMARISAPDPRRRYGAPTLWQAFWLRAGLAAAAAAWAVTAAVIVRTHEPEMTLSLPPAPPAAVVVTPPEWHDLTRTEQALGATDSLVLSTPDPSQGRPPTP